MNVAPDFGTILSTALISVSFDVKSVNRNSTLTVEANVTTDTRKSSGWIGSFPMTLMTESRDLLNSAMLLCEESMRNTTSAGPGLQSKIKI